VSVPVQVAQGCPPTPQEGSLVPGWQAPALSTQPAQAPARHLPPKQTVPPLQAAQNAPPTPQALVSVPGAQASEVGSTQPSQLAGTHWPC
jgi:hypothetical protein